MCLDLSSSCSTTAQRFIFFFFKEKMDGQVVSNLALDGIFLFYYYSFYFSFRKKRATHRHRDEKERKKERKRRLVSADNNVPGPGRASHLTTECGTHFNPKKYSNVEILLWRQLNPTSVRVNSNVSPILF